jgi:hypothetical protein
MSKISTSEVARSVTELRKQLEANIRTELKKRLPEVTVNRIVFMEDFTRFGYLGRKTDLSDDQVNTISRTINECWTRWRCRRFSV